MEQKQIQVPENTDRIVIRGRHAKSVQDGTNQTRTLTSEGVELCGKVRGDYNTLINCLSSIFGKPVFACSEFPRSLITNFLITGATQIVQDPRLTLKISVKKAPAPSGSTEKNFYEHCRKAGMSTQEIVQTVISNPTLFGNQPVSDSVVDNLDFIYNFSPESKLVVAFDHEPVISMAAINHIPKDDLGLDECQAVIFFLDAEKYIIGAQKFAPAATVKTKDAPRWNTDVNESCCIG